MCEEYESLHERTGRPGVVGQSSSSLVLSVIKIEVPLDNDDPAYQKIFLQQKGVRIEKLSQHDKLSKFCMDAGFLSVVENGQYFMTKDTADLSQFHAVACREYTLPRDEEASQPKGWVPVNTKIGPVLEVTTCCMQGRGSESLANLNNTEHETSEMQLEEYALKLNASDFPSRSKATKNRSHWKKELDRYCYREIFSLRIRGIEESNVSSSSFTTNASRRRRSGSFLENERKSSEPIPTVFSLMLQQQLFMSELFKVIQDAILLILHYRTMLLFRATSSSIFTNWMCIHFTFYYQFRIDTWRSKFEQETDSIFPACWSYGQKPQGSWCDWLECTASCTIPA